MPGRSGRCHASRAGSERSDKGAQFADGFLPKQIAHSQPARLNAHHGGFADEHAVAIASGHQRAGLCSVERDWLFAQDMLAGRSRALRPWHMQMVGSGLYTASTSGSASRAS